MSSLSIHSAYSNSTLNKDKDQDSVHQYSEETDSDNSHQSEIGMDKDQEEEKVKEDEGKEEVKIGDGKVAPQYYEGWRLGLVQLSLNLILFIAALDIVIVTSAIEKISEQFGEYSKSAWLITGYSLPNAVCCLIWSRLSQKLGKKMSVCLAVVVFEIGSLIVAVSNSMNMLIGGRVIAGIAGSGIQTLMFVVGATLVPEEKRPMVLSLLAFSFTVSSVIGPFIGGAFTNAPKGSVLSWRWCFYINLPIGFFALAIFYLAYDDRESSFMKIVRYWRENFVTNVKRMFTDKKVYILLLLETVITFDIIGFLSSSAGYVLGLLAFTFSTTKDTWNNGLVISFFVVGVLLAIASFIYEYFYYSKVVAFLERKFSNYEGIEFNFKETSPLFPKVALNNKYIVIVNATTFLVICAYGFQATYIIQYFQLIFHDSPLKASIHFISFMVAISIVVISCGLITSKTGYLKPFIVLSGVGSVLGNALLSTLDGKSNEAKKILYLIIASSSFGFIAQGSLLSSQAQLDKKDPHYMMNFVGVTAVNSFAKTMAISVGSVVATMIFNLSVISKAKKLDPPIYLNANDIVTYTAEHCTGPTSHLSNMISSCIHIVFYTSTAISACGLFFSVFVSNKKVITKKEIKRLAEQKSEAYVENLALLQDFRCSGLLQIL